MIEKTEATLSIRWLFPFVRVTGTDPSSLSILQREGITLQLFAHPETRMRHAAVMELLEVAVARRNDPALGLHAGEAFEPGDVGALEYVARTCPNLRESIFCSQRYMGLMHDAQESELVEQDDWAAWQLRTVDDVPQPTAANDFILSGAAWFVRTHTGQRFPFREVHFRHDDATNAVEYARVFDGAVVRYGMPSNAIVFDRNYLELPMRLAQPGLEAAFRQVVEEKLASRQRKLETICDRVRERILKRIATGDVNMAGVARDLATSEATLRRRIGEHGTTFSDIVDGVRNELAVKYLADPTLSIRDVAFLLGFAHVTAFYKAFSRTKRATPAQVRAQLLSEARG